MNGCTERLPHPRRNSGDHHQPNHSNADYVYPKTNECRQGQSGGSHMKIDVCERRFSTRPEYPAVTETVVMVVHEVPAYRQGLRSGLSDVGFAVREAPSAALVGDGWNACLLTVGSVRDCDALAELRHRGPVVALLADPTPVNYQLALRYGAAGAVAQSAALHEIGRALCAALDGMALLPVAVARALTAGAAPTPDALQLSGQLTEWLRALSQGLSIAAIAQIAGYSERQMYRRIQQLYRCIGARDRREAILIAARWGLD